MASTYSSNLKIELITTGEQSGSWGVTTNNNFSNVFEQAIVGRGTANFSSDANLTLTFVDSVTSQTARNLYLNVTSGVSLTATRDLIVPTIYKNYVVENNTTGGQSIRVKTSAGTGITIPNGRKAAVYVDGTNVVIAWDWVAIAGGTISNVTFSGTLAGSPNFSGSPTVDSSAIVTLAATQTLTNKTLTSPNIAQISNTGTLTLPTSTDTLVGRNTTDTLTNKTLTTPSISNPTMTGGGSLAGTYSGTPTFSGNVTFSSTGAITTPVGTEAQRPGTPATGMLRFSSTSGEFEGYDGSAWASVGGSAINGVFYENDTTVSADYTVTANKNAGSFGPITINSGVTVTVPSTSTWSIV